MGRRVSVRDVSEVVVRSGRASEIVHPDRRKDLEDLAAQLRDAGHAVRLEIVDYVPGRRGITLFESVTLYLAGAVGTPLLGRLTEDLYDTVKRWALGRWRRKTEGGEFHRPLSFTILGPDGEVLKSWKVDKDGERDL